MTELVRTYDDAELVDDEAPGYDWESGVSEWAEGSRMEFVGKLRQARAAAGVARRYGFGSMQKFAGEVGASRTTVYDAARVWVVYGHIFDGGDPLAEALEAKGYTHMVDSLRAPDPIEDIKIAIDNDETTRQHEDRLQGGEEKEAGNVELISEFKCPDCESWHRLNGVETREVPNG